MWRSPRRLSAHVLGLALLSAPLAAPRSASAAPVSSAVSSEGASSASSSAAVPGARALENRLIAPCCWNQTLDIHESEVATALRAEIERRLLSGEAAAAIEDDIVARYGERIRAMPKGREPLHQLAAVLAAMTALAAGGLFFVVRGWRARVPAAQPQPPSCEREDALDDYDARLDAELRSE